MMILASTFVWQVADFLAGNSSTLGWKLLWARVVYAAVPVVVLGAITYVLIYTGKESYLTPRTLGLLAIEPVVFIAAVWTNQYHGLVWSNPQLVSDSYFGMDLTMQIGFHLHAIYSYTLLLAAVGLLAQLLREGQSLYPGQVYAVMAAVLAPSVSDLLYQIGVIQIEVTPLAFTISGLILTMGAFQFKLFDISPASQQSVVENIRDGLFVLDRDDEFVEINGVARSYLDLEEQVVVGESADDVLSQFPDLYDQFGDAIDAEGEVQVDTSSGSRFFHVQVTPLHDHREERIGRQFLIHDVTNRVERKRELERQNEQLDRFASVVSHDLRNPLSVASGHLELARETDDESHLDTVEASHRKMENLIEEMLILARDGQTIATTTQVSLPEVVNSAWRNTATADATLTIDTGLRLDADEARLTRLFENLFRNTIEHAGPASAVEIGALNERTGAQVVGFYVADDGPGIPDDEREQVFDDGFTTDDDGTGLGLSIVASIAEAHGWTVTVTESRRGGARFEVSDVASATEVERAFSNSTT